MLNSLASLVCSCSLALLYINILALLFMSRSLIGAAEWETPIITPTILNQYYELRTRLFHSSNYSYNVQSNRIVIISTFTLTYSEFVFVFMVAILAIIYLMILSIAYVYSLFKELGVLQFSQPHDCPICMEGMRRFIRVSSLKCGHTFCKRCLDLWVKRYHYRTCPMCRQPVEPQITDNPSSMMVEMMNMVLTEISDTESDDFIY